MRSTRVLSLVAVTSLLTAFGCSSTESNEFGVSAQALLTEPLLNEISFNPPSTDNPYEYVEIRFEPNASLTGYQFVYLEGDDAAASSPATGRTTGLAKRVTYLTGATTGSAGLLLMKATSGGHSAPAGAGVFPDSMFDVSGGGLENGSGTFLLVKGTALSQNTDYDANDDGVLELPQGTIVVDAIGVTDGGIADRVYGPLAAIASGTPGAVSRFSDDVNASSAAAWYAGALSGAANSDLPYSATSCSAIMPANAALTPGALNLARPLAVDGGAAADAGSVQDASVAVDGGSTPVDAGSAPVDASFPPVAADPYLNEILFNPASTDGPWEYIEIKGTPGASVSGFQIVYVDGDSTQIGIAKLVIPLTGDLLGSAGFLVAKSNLQGHTLPPGCTLRSDNAFDATNGCLENGTGTFILVRGATLVQNTDYDTNDDGTLDLPAGAVVVDAVSFTDGGSSDKPHGPVVATASGTQPGGVSRLVGNTSRGAATAWFGATISGASNNLVYDASNATANMPAGAALTPGAENAQGAPGPVDAGAPVVDAGSPVVDAGVRDAGSLPVDAGAPSVDAGARDAGAPVVTDAGSTAVDAGAPADGGAKTDAGVKTDAGISTQPVFGDEEKKACGCAVVGSSRGESAGLAWVTLAGFVVLAARRRREGR